MIGRSLLVVALLGAAPVPALAQQPQFTPSDAYRQCMMQPDAARGIATATDLCLGLEQTVQLDRLGQAYQRAFDALTGWDQVRLHNDQAEWRAGLDDRCAEAARQDPRNATDSRAFNICRTEEIAARAAILDRENAE
ncbi:MAG: hypothetical protein ABIO29_03660 [Sphingomicrobium sp.]